MRTLVVAGLLAATTAGCGGKDPAPRSSTPEARAAVVAFVRALDAGDGASACATATPRLVAELRESAAGRYVATAHGLAARLRQVRVAHAKARTCPGAIGLLRTEIGAAGRARLLAGARTLPAQWLGPGRHVVTLGDEDWDVVRVGDRWRVDIANALGDV